MSHFTKYFLTYKFTRLPYCLPNVIKQYAQTVYYIILKKPKPNNFEILCM